MSFKISHQLNNEELLFKRLQGYTFNEMSKLVEDHNKKYFTTWKEFKYHVACVFGLRDKRITFYHNYRIESVELLESRGWTYEKYMKEKHGPLAGALLISLDMAVSM